MFPENVENFSKGSQVPGGHSSHWSFGERFAVRYFFSYTHKITKSSCKFLVAS